MKTIKLSITCRARLAKKYDAHALARIDKAIARWVAADDVRGIKTIHLAVDDAKAMKAFKVPPVKGSVTAAKVKKALDALVARLSPDYIVIVGADDVVPLFRVHNPSAEENGDDDDVVPTDNPYACSKPFTAKVLASYLVPDRVVGRIPDLPGAADPAWLVDYLDHATTWAARPASAYAKGLLVCCDSWRGSGRECAKTLGQASKDLLVSPPIGDASTQTRKRHGALLHMIKCHGTDQDSWFYGEKNGKFPDALRSPSLVGRTKRNAVVGAMCCYGANLFDPGGDATQHPNETPIPNVYLKQGAHGFLGSTTIAWVGPNTMMCADWIVTAFLKSAVSGASLGRAALESKQDFLRWLQQQGDEPDVADEKTLIQFVLLGNPSIHPVVSPSHAAAATPAGAKGKAAAVAAASAGGPAAVQRQQRRALRHQLGGILRDGLPARQPARVVAPKAVQREVQSIAAPAGNGSLRWRAARVEQLTSRSLLPELQPRAAAAVPGAARRARNALAARKTYQYIGWPAGRGMRSSEFLASAWSPCEPTATATFWGAASLSRASPGD